MFTLFLNTGLRISEVISLQLSDCYKVIIPETISETKDKSSLKLDILYSTDVQQSLEIQIVKLSIGIINES